MLDQRMSRRAQDRSADGRAARGRFRPFLLAAAAGPALALALGWYGSHQREESERLEALRRLTAAQQELAETKSDLQSCEAWMDSKLLMAQNQPEPAAPTPAAPVVAAPEPTNRMRVPEGESREHSKAGLALRRRRMLAFRGEAGEVQDEVDAGLSP